MEIIEGKEHEENRNAANRKKMKDFPRQVCLRQNQRLILLLLCTHYLACDKWSGG
jgi:hypothetical protein